ncbi:MAG: hypothetical protein HFJ35_07370 [Clostridia bacterium]|nr:hypothetical protein [Clostridia bacterium]
MKKSNLIKLFSILLIAVMVMMFSTSVLAATDNEGWNLITELDTNNTNTNNTNRNTNTNNTNTNTNTNRTNTNNSSSYNNTNLPKTGVESSIPVAVLVVIFGVSTVYAYKKIRDYKDIK